MSVAQSEDLQSASDSEDSEDEDLVPRRVLNNLATDKDVRAALCNPHVRDMLKTLDTEERPVPTLKEYMKIPIFSELADACLNVYRQSKGDMDHSSADEDGVVWPHSHSAP